MTYLNWHANLIAYTYFSTCLHNACLHGVKDMVDNVGKSALSCRVVLYQFQVSLPFTVSVSGAWPGAVLEASEAGWCDQPVRVQ